MANLQAVYYRAADGTEPVNDFIEQLSAKRQVAVDNQVDRLNMLTLANPHLPFPHSSQVEGELRELRCHYGSELYRVLFRRSKNLIVLLHIFQKKTGSIPPSEIDVASNAGTTSKRGWKPSRVGSREQRVTTLLELLTNFGKVRSAHA